MKTARTIKQNVIDYKICNNLSNIDMVKAWENTLKDRFNIPESFNTNII